MGCVSCAVLHHTEYPLLLLNVKVNEDKETGTCRLDATELLRHVLHPTDFSEIAKRAFGYLERLAPQGVTQATLLHALEGVAGMQYPPGFQEAADSDARESQAELRERLLAAGVSPVNMRLSFGHPVQLILDAMKGQDFSLIVMGTQGKGFIEEIFLGSVAHNISRLASCPVLLIPPVSR